MVKLILYNSLGGWPGPAAETGGSIVMCDQWFISLPRIIRIQTQTWRSLALGRRNILYQHNPLRPRWLSPRICTSKSAHFVLKPVWDKGAKLLWLFLSTLGWTFCVLYPGVFGKIVVLARRQSVTRTALSKDFNVAFVVQLSRNPRSSATRLDILTASVKR